MSFVTLPKLEESETYREFSQIHNLTLNTRFNIHRVSLPLTWDKTRLYEAQSKVNTWRAFKLF